MSPTPDDPHHPSHPTDRRDGSPGADPPGTDSRGADWTAGRLGRHTDGRRGVDPVGAVPAGLWVRGAVARAAAVWGEALKRFRVYVERKGEAPS